MIELAGGWKAEIKSGPIAWGPKNRIRDAVENGWYSGFAETLCRELTERLYDPSGAIVELKPDELPDDVGDALLVHCMGVWKAKPDPKDSAETPAPTPPG